METLGVTQYHFLKNGFDVGVTGIWFDHKKVALSHSMFLEYDASEIFLRNPGPEHQYLTVSAAQNYHSDSVSGFAGDVCVLKAAVAMGVRNRRKEITKVRQYPQPANQPTMRVQFFAPFTRCKFIENGDFDQTMRYITNTLQSAGVEFKEDPQFMSHQDQRTWSMLILRYLVRPFLNRFPIATLTAWIEKFSASLFGAEEVVEAYFAEDSVSNTTSWENKAVSVYPNNDSDNRSGNQSPLTTSGNIRRVTPQPLVNEFLPSLSNRQISQTTHDAVFFRSTSTPPGSPPTTPRQSLS